MSSSDIDSVGTWLRAYFGIGYHPEDPIEKRLTRLKRRKTINRLLWIVGLLVFVWFLQVALGLVEFDVFEINEYFGSFVESLGDFFPTTNVSVFGISFPFIYLDRYADFLYGNAPNGMSLGTGPFILDLFVVQINTGIVVPQQAIDAAWTTLAIGFAGTALGAPGALVFGILGSERVTPFPFNFIFRGIMSTIRSIPALVWALIYIPLGGLSPFTATLAIGTDTIGNLGRLFTDALEEVEDGPIEGIKSTGANRPQTIFFGMLSQVVTPFIAWTLYILEINTRIAVTMGLIGAGGIGGILNTERKLIHGYNMMATIIVIFFLVVSVEMISQRTRSYLRGTDNSDEQGLFSQLFEIIRQFPQKMADAAWK